SLFELLDDSLELVERFLERNLRHVGRDGLRRRAALLLLFGLTGHRFSLCHVSTAPGGSSLHMPHGILRDPKGRVLPRSRRANQSAISSPSKTSRASTSVKRIDTRPSRISFIWISDVPRPCARARPRPRPRPRRTRWRGGSRPRLRRRGGRAGHPADG